jgi:hypothetical protein
LTISGCSHTRVSRAGVVKLVDAEDSKSSGRKPMRVRFPPPAPNEKKGLAFSGQPLFLSGRSRSGRAMNATGGRPAVPPSRDPGCFRRIRAGAPKISSVARRKRNQRTAGPPNPLEGGNPAWRSGRLGRPCYGRENITVSRPLVNKIPPDFVGVKRALFAFGLVRVRRAARVFSVLRRGPFRGRKPKKPRHVPQFRSAPARMPEICGNRR